MGLTWRDGIATLLVAGAVAVALSVVYALNWPLMGDARAAIVAVFLLGFPACIVGGGPTTLMAGLGWGSHRRWDPDAMWSWVRGGTWRPGMGMWSPLVMLAAALGCALLILMVVGLIVNTVAILIWTAVLVAAIWLVATAYHALQPRPGPLARRVP